MTLTTGQRQIALGVILLATLAVSVVSSNEIVDDGVVRPALKFAGGGHDSGSESKPMVVASLDPRQIRRDEDATAAVDVFAVKSWAPPPPVPAPVVMQPVIPVAPPLPFQYVGQMSEPDGKVIVYLTRGAEVYTVKVGDLVESQYRLEHLDEASVTLNYLPMNQQQILAIPPR